MPQTLDALIGNIDPRSTVLFFGSGSSIPSGAPSAQQLIDIFSTEFSEPASDYTLAELTGIIQQKTNNRKRVIRCLRKSLADLKPTGGLTNLPLYEWRAIYTTNYDQLIERSYDRNESDITVISSNFDFGFLDNPLAVKLFKIHGSIEKDISDGYSAPIILTESDYEHTKDYREKLYDRLASDLNEFNVVIIGYSLSDPDLRRAIDRAAALNAQSYGDNRIYVIVFEKDDNRALLLENRGISVSFGSIDEFFAKLAEHIEVKTEPKFDFSAPLSSTPKLRPITIDVEHAVTSRKADASGMYNGRPADYPEIGSGLTYNRILAPLIVDSMADEGLLNAIILAPSGYGKTTCARQAILMLREKGFHCFEHAGDHRLLPEEWAKVGKYLADKGARGVLLVDDAHHHLTEINALVGLIAAQEQPRLHLIMTSSKNLWGPRIKAAPIFKDGREFTLKKLSGPEIDNLLNLLDHEPRIRNLVSPSFSGFSRFEKRRRLEVKCEAEPFVCLRNIFDSENFDHIILREFAELRPELREVYRIVAAMENSGVRVHRQLVIRMLGIPADKIRSILSDLEGIVSEYVIDGREAVYGWKGRHPVIVAIVSEYKFFDTEKVLELLDRVIDNISPSYDVEIKTIRDICTLDTGIRRIPSKKEQNRLYQRVISIAPNERVPRHRLIRNLLDLDDFEQADTEIRIFENDFKSDGAVARYKVALAVRRATRATGLLEEDRMSILLRAVPFAQSQSKRYKDNKYFLRECVALGFEIFKRSGDLTFYDEAIGNLSDAFARLGDPDIVSMIRKFENEVAGRRPAAH